MARLRRVKKSLAHRKAELEVKTANRKRNHEGTARKREAFRERERLKAQQG